MRIFGGTPSDDTDAVERDLDLAWELFAARPTHPKVGELALRVLAAQPERSSAALLLGNHRELCGEMDEARRLYRRVAGRRDRQFVNAARALRHLALTEHDHAEALRWARTVLKEEHEAWDDWMELGFALALHGESDDGWRQLDDALELCARTAPEELSKALGKRAAYLLGTFAAPDRFVPAAEESIRADATNSWVAVMLGWAYVATYRFAEAEQLALRLLREDPTEDQYQNLLQTARTMQQVVENASTEGITLDDIRRSGVVEVTWQHIRDQALGVDLASALAALGDVMPAELRASLRPGASVAGREKVGAMAAEKLVAWHDGQKPGSGAAWGLADPFRLMSAAEISAMDAEIEADPAAHPGWPQDEAWEQVMTDDDGAHLVVVAFGALVKRRPGLPDEPVAASMADWIWDRVADFGGRDPRPAPRKRGDAARGPSDPSSAFDRAGLSTVPGTSLSGSIATMYAALGTPESSAAYEELHQTFPGAAVRRSVLDPVEASAGGVDIALRDGVVTKVTVDLALAPSADRVISGLDGLGPPRAVDVYLREHGALPHNSWEDRATGEVTVNYDLGEHRLGLQWVAGSLARIVVTATEPADT